MMKQFALQPVVHYGQGSLEALRMLKGEKALIVTDQVMVQVGIVKIITDHLEAIGMDYVVFDQVKPNPSIGTVVQILKLWLEIKPDTMIGLGGGSPIDAAKGALYFGKKIQQTFSGISSDKTYDFVAIPTTSGTGSEVTAYSVLTEEEKGLKIPLAHKVMLPTVAILDPELTKTLPKSVIADTGMDVLTHAVEAYVSREANPYTDALALKAINDVFTHLVAHYEDVGDLEHRQAMQNASCLAGMAFNNASLGINHSLAHGLGGQFHIPHGKINAILMPYVIAYNSGIMTGALNPCAKRYYELAKMLGLPSSTMEEGVKAFLAGVKVLNQLLGLPESLKAYGLEEKAYRESIKNLAILAKKDICTGGNPLDPSLEDLEMVLLKAYDGQ